jgi:hypothetical protein
VWNAVAHWREGVLTLVGGGLGDARALLAGPGGELWVLSGYGPTHGFGNGTLALTRLGRGAGQQQHHEAMIYWATVMTMSKRLARPSTNQRRGQPRPAPAAT